MTGKSTLLAAAALAAGGGNYALAFAPPRSSLSFSSSSRTDPTPASLSNSNNGEIMTLAEEMAALTLDPNPSPRGIKCATPSGYGFSSSISRILKKRRSDGYGTGYFRANSSTSVVDVMEGINGGMESTTAALVFDDENPELLLGIFTDADYIKLDIERSSN
jgi:hypothetical protein